MDWTRSLSDTLREALLTMGEIQEFTSGEIMIQAGACDTHLFHIISGEVVVQTHPDPTQLQAGDLLGEMAFLDNRLRTASAVAVGEVRARRIERQDFFLKLCDRPLKIAEFLKALSTLQSSRLEKNLRQRKTEPRAFVNNLAQAALSHRAVRHPYLRAIERGGFPDMGWALADFARHYHGYSAHFPRYLTALISRLEQPHHRAILLENLAEESGHYNDEDLDRLETMGIEREWIVDVPHPLLFQRFREALGMHEESDVNEHIEVVCWRDMFINVLSYASPTEAVGALGLGTENIVRHIYVPFVSALEAFGGIRARDAAFFPLHTVVDDGHQEALNDIACELAVTSAARSDLAQGMYKALALRANFWSWLHERAENPGRSADG